MPRLAAAELIKRPLLHRDELVGGEPFALVVGHQQRTARSEADAVGRSQTAGDDLRLARVDMHLDHAAAQRSLTVVLVAHRHADAGGEKEMRVLHDGAEEVLVIVHRAGPVVRQAAIGLERTVAVFVEQFGRFVLLGDKDAPVRDGQAHRFRKSLREAAEWRRPSVGNRRQVERIEVAVPGGEDQFARTTQRHAADSQRERFVAQIAHGKRRVQRGQLLTEAGRRVGRGGFLRRLSERQIAGRLTFAALACESGADDRICDSTAAPAAPRPAVRHAREMCPALPAPTRRAW